MQDVTPDSNQALSWRPHAILAETYLRQGSAESAIKEAELALELGQGQATAVRPILARALADYGDKDRAISILQEHVKEYPSDVAANILLESLQSYPLLNKLGSGPAAANRKIDPTLAAGVTSLPSIPDGFLLTWMNGCPRSCLVPRVISKIFCKRLAIA